MFNKVLRTGVTKTGLDAYLGSSVLGLTNKPAVTEKGHIWTITTRRQVTD